jgi:hypothetical protein
VGVVKIIVSGERNTIFRVEKFASEGNVFLYNPHDVTSQKTMFFKNFLDHLLVVALTADGELNVL